MAKNHFTPAERRAAGSAGGHNSWGATEDRTARTAKARKATMPSTRCAWATGPMLALDQRLADQPLLAGEVVKQAGPDRISVRQVATELASTTRQHVRGERREGRRLTLVGTPTYAQFSLTGPPFWLRVDASAVRSAGVT